MIDIIPIKIQDRCAVIAELVQKMQPMYQAETTSEYQRNHIETTVGAGIWYIPNSELWTGRVSLVAIKSFHPLSNVIEPKLTKDHQYPRKVAARKLLECDWSQIKNPEERLTRMYVEEFGTFTLVTPQENRDLMKYQKADVFTTPQKAYHQAGITLLQLTKSQLQYVKKRDEAAINDLLDSYTLQK